MKIIKKRLKLIALVFSMLILFQGCTVYKSANVTLEDALKSETVVKVKTNENKSQKFDRIGFENNYYYGLNYKTGEDLKVRLDDNKIKKVQVKDKLASTLLLVGVPALIILAFPAPYTGFFPLFK